MLSSNSAGCPSSSSTCVRLSCIPLASVRFPLPTDPTICSELCQGVRGLGTRRERTNKLADGGAAEVPAAWNWGGGLSDAVMLV